MRWRRALLWLASGELAGLAAGVLAGSVAGMLEPRAGEPLARLVLGGAVSGLGAALVFLILGFPLLLLSVVAWVLLARIVPSLEASRLAVALGLSVPVGFLATGFVLALPEEPQAGTFVTVLALAALLAPRFLIRRLRPGTFGREGAATERSAPDLAPRGPAGFEG